MTISRRVRTGALANLFLFGFAVHLFAQSSGAGLVTIDVTAGHSINAFEPDSALGSSIDVLSRKDIDQVFTPHILQESLSAGWGPITYRNNSELRMAAWHWNEKGTWSDSGGKRGYFIGSTDLGDPIRYILSYALPHRGFSTSGDRPLQGPNLTYWKSNPYLTSKFTGESDALAPAMGGRGSPSGKTSGCDSHCLGEPIRSDLSSGVLGRKRCTRF